MTGGAKNSRKKEDFSQLGQGQAPARRTHSRFKNV